MVYGIISAKDNQTSLAYFKSKKVSQLEPENLKGRGLIKVDGEVMEFQTAIATDRCDDMERIELLRNMCASMAEGATEVAEGVPEIPEKPTWEIFKRRNDVAQMCNGYMLPIGYDSVSGDME